MENKNFNEENKRAYFESLQYLQQVKEETEFERIIKILLIPAKSGIYISREDIRRIGKLINVEIPVKERKFMLKDLFLYAKQFDMLKDFLNLLIEFANNRVEQYLALKEAYPKSAKLMDIWINKADRLIKYLEQLKKEIDIY